MNDLIQLIQRTWQSSSPFVWRENGSYVSFGEFWQQVAQRVLYLTTQSSSSCVLWLDDCGDFFAWLWACVLTKKNVILPPALTVGVIDEFDKQQAIFVHKLPALPTTLSTPNICQMDIDWQDCLNTPCIYFYTSGSTGKPKSIVRTMAQLLSEGRQVGQTFDFPESFSVFMSVSHQHLYGLTFGLLLPFVYEQSLFGKQLIYPENIEHALHIHPKAHAKIVISSPALLGRCVGVYDFALACRVFSSGGRLDNGVREHYPQGITEIYGSSETGAIAYRGDDTAWQVLSDVAIKTSDDNTLMIRSPRAYQHDWVDTKDLVAIDERGFVLLGRADRIIKLEEKRLSLDEIEQALSELEAVDDVAVVVVEHGGRSFLSVAVVLSSFAKPMLIHNKKQVITSLKEQLKHRLEPIAIPKHWRFVDRLPRNAQSKLSREWVKNLFLNQNYPHILSQKEDDNSVHYCVQFLPELNCFKGHFDEFAIYPAVGQVAFINHFAKERWADFGYVCAFEQMKFQSPIRPYDVIELTLQRQDDKVRFCLVRGDKTVATGRIVYA